MKLVIKPMDRESAELIVTWSYPEPYHIYGMEADEESFSEMLGGEYHAAFQDGVLVGYFCWGDSAMIPWAVKEGLYRPGYVDIGLAMRPDLVGQGLGLKFFSCGIEHAREMHPGSPIRLTVAAFNGRARKVYLKAGFRQTESFSVPDGLDFVIMEKE